jgi:hypothetical protein
MMGKKIQTVSKVNITQKRISVAPECPHVAALIEMREPVRIHPEATEISGDLRSLSTGRGVSPRI